ncbi:flagellar biosynthetic protein FliO [Noviherbaspirillum sp. Root189]|uniref:flagellar biosynthetic protein FliO n=1 Tax=Noviherbaspirillum sp. Root189 TaxID=1736487 RepID=UPI00070ADF83|nr:flagellar biosynthetic protein FliO [Noviherbaspirillum sp. Root189]KRB93328.1 flagellar assembly protein FliO [Noviherbaspirillum sp. Root189]
MTISRLLPAAAAVAIALFSAVAQAAEQAATVAPATTTATTATTAASTGSAGNLLQVLVGLVIVLGLMAGAAWLLKRMGVAGAAGANVARVVGGVNVGNRERVLVVEVADQWIVVGVAPGRVSALSTMPKQENAPTSEPLPEQKNFATWLKQTIDKRNAR